MLPFQELFDLGQEVDGVLGVVTVLWPKGWVTVVAEVVSQCMLRNVVKWRSGLNSEYALKLIILI